MFEKAEIMINNDKRKSYLVYKAIYYSIWNLVEKLLSIKMGKRQVKINKPVCFRFSFSI